MEATSADWKAKRKAISTVFYKDQMTMMIDIVSSTVAKSLKEWDEKYVDKDVVVDFNLLQNELGGKVIIACAFGEVEDVSKMMFPNKIKGEIVELTFFQTVVNFQRVCVERTLSP